MQHNTKQTCTVSVFQNIKQLCPANNNKQALIEKYCFYDQTTQNYPTANNPNKTLFAFYTLFTSKIIIMPTVNNTPIVFIALQPSSIAEKDSKHNNRPQKNSTYPQVENITILPEHHFSLKNTTTCLLKRQRYRSIRVGHFPRHVSMAIFIYNQKSFVHR